MGKEPPKPLVKRAYLLPKLRPFQDIFLTNATKKGIDTACLSLPRGNGKSWISAVLLSRILDPRSNLFVRGTESVLCAASIEQARIVFRFVREFLEPTGAYRFVDSTTRIGVCHVATNTRLRVIGSNGRTAFGLVGTPWVIADEPGAWENTGGTLVYDAIETAKGKPNSPLKALYIGTLAPALTGWWHDLVAKGSHGSTYVQSLQGDPEKWGQWPEIRRCNPLVDISPDFRRKLLEERDSGRLDTRLKSRFLSYRLNVPTPDESSVLLTVDDWNRVCEREVAPRAGRPIVGIDLGAGRAWCAAVALWRSGRIEACAIAPGIPSIPDQEKRDRVPVGTYQALVQSGSLRIAAGLRVQPVSALVELVRERWGTPEVFIADRARINELRDSVTDVPIDERVTRWFDAAEDIRATRQQALDGPLSCELASRGLLSASLSAALVKSDDQGSVRMVKRGSNNTARDDVAAALVLACGLLSRAPPPQRAPRFALLG